MLSQAALGALALAIAVNGAALDAKQRFSLFPRAASCPSTVPESCPPTSGSDSCCNNNAYFLQTQFFDTNPPVGPSNSWTIHGLWPDNCDGTYEASCDPSRAYTNITQILQSAGATDTLSYMQTYWLPDSGTGESFWEHEWSKHGTCITTLDPDCYGSTYQPQQEVVEFFQRTVALFKTLPTYQWLANAGITPSTSKTYSLSQLQSVAKANFGQNIVWNCQNGVLNEAWYGFTTRGTVTDGSFDPAAPVGSSTCPSTGIKYLPKSSSSTTSSSSPSPTGGSGGSAPSKIYLNVYPNGSSSNNGCLISSGKWYTSGTCATYTTSASGSGYTLSTSKGPCQISSSTFTCASGLTPTTFSFDSAGNLVYSGSSRFYSSSIPSGTAQVSVLTSSSSNTLRLNYQAA